MLINLSNHPSSQWNEKQLVAAKAYGDLVDIQFPVVDESGDEEYIVLLANQYIEKIMSMGTLDDLTVHLMGEMTFTFALLKKLQEYGIRCVASTSKRIVKEEVSGRKEEVIFEFERFREYC